jgi:hypothetical protein
MFQNYLGCVYQQTGAVGIYIYIIILQKAIFKNYREILINISTFMLAQKSLKVVQIIPCKQKYMCIDLIFLNT